MRSLHYQDLNESGHRLFHFRGAVGSSWDSQWFKYELASGKAFKFRINPEETKTRFTLGLIFFSIYLTIYGLRIPLLTKGREFGFYTSDWALHAHFGSKPWESDSRDPWYYSISFYPLDFLFGKTIHFDDTIMKSYSPQRFMFRGKEYVMDEIKILRGNWFRSRIPFGLYKKQLVSLSVDIKNPPMRAGKGENSYDCDDDAIFGLSRDYKGPEPTWQNKKAVFEWCCRRYCEEAFKDIRKYGRAAGDELPGNYYQFEFLGEPAPTNPTADVKE